MGQHVESSTSGPQGVGPRYDKTVPTLLARAAPKMDNELRVSAILLHAPAHDGISAEAPAEFPEREANVSVRSIGTQLQPAT